MDERRQVRASGLGYSQGVVTAKTQFEAARGARGAW